MKPKNVLMVYLIAYKKWINLILEQKKVGVKNLLNECVITVRISLKILFFLVSRSASVLVSNKQCHQSLWDDFICFETLEVG